MGDDAGGEWEVKKKGKARSSSPRSLAEKHADSQKLAELEQKWDAQRSSVVWTLVFRVLK